ncbi:MAG: tetratricopeptide repeat protein [Candidatus Krumholzibacteriia bacterium]
MTLRSLARRLGPIALILLASCGGPPPVETESPAPPVAAGDVVEHPVREGETLSRIADLYYGDPGRAADIAAANGVAVDSQLAPGSVVHLRFGDAEMAAARVREAALLPYNRGVAALDQGDLTEAERQFRLARRTDPGLLVADYNLALVLIKRGRHEDAVALLTPLVAARPSEADYGFALGNALFYQTRYPEAAAAFAAVLAVHPDHRRAAFGYARSLQEAGERDAALAAWSSYLQLDPSSPWADEARRLRRALQDG